MSQTSNYVLQGKYNAVLCSGTQVNPPAVVKIIFDTTNPVEVQTESSWHINYTLYPGAVMLEAG